MFPNRFRAAALSVAAAAQWASNWAITMSFPVIEKDGPACVRLPHVRGVRIALVPLRLAVRAGDEG